MALFARPPSWRLFGVRLVHLNLGLVLYGLSIAFTLRAGIGLGPWDVFHQGAALRTPLSIGQVMVLAGFALLLYSGFVARVRIGIGTVMNMILIGVWVDVFLARPWFPTAAGWLDGAGLFALGLALNGVATGLYITAGLGAGPRDGFVLGVAAMTRAPVRRVRTIVELSVFAVGWALGGSVGAGTVAFALGIGPAMQAGLRLFSGLEQCYRRADQRAGARKTAREVPRAATD
ncbi:MAG: hypothetical protein R6W77_07270 [Trueperaceae bacterium]